MKRVYILLNRYIETMFLQKAFQISIKLLCFNISKVWWYFEGQELFFKLETTKQTSVFTELKPIKLGFLYLTVNCIKDESIL